MARLWGRDGSRWTSVARHWGDIREHQMTKDDPSIHTGVIGAEKPTAQQLAGKRSRDAKRAAKTPVHEDLLYS